MDQLGRKIGKPFELPFSGPKLDGHILTFHITQFVEPLPECIEKMSTGRQGARPENSYASFACCADAASGHTTVAPPRSVMNSRRRISAPKFRPALYALGLAL